MKKMWEMLQCCFNWRIAAGLAVVAAGIWVLHPSWLAAAGPLLFYALCPLSMGAMMFIMMRGQNSSPAVSHLVDPAAKPMVTISASRLERLMQMESRLGLRGAENAELEHVAALPVGDSHTTDNGSVGSLPSANEVQHRSASAPLRAE
jgi:hypothetical protein